MYGMSQSHHIAPCCSTRLTRIGQRCTCGHLWNEARYAQFDFATDILAVEAEMEAVQDLARGDVFAAEMDMAAAQDYARGDVIGGEMDQILGDLL